MGVIEVFDGGCISSASCFEAYIDEVKDRGSLFGRRVSGRKGDVIPFPGRGFPVPSLGRINNKLDTSPTSFNSATPQSLLECLPFLLEFTLPTRITATNTQPVSAVVRRAEVLSRAEMALQCLLSQNSS